MKIKKQCFFLVLLLVISEILVLNNMFHIDFNTDSTQRINQEIYTAADEEIKMVEWNFSRPTNFAYDANLIELGPNNMQLKSQADGSYATSEIFMNIPIRDIYLEDIKNVTIEWIDNGQSIQFVASDDNVYWSGESGYTINKLFTMGNELPWRDITTFNEYLPTFCNTHTLPVFYMGMKLISDGFDTPVVESVKIYYNRTTTPVNPNFLRYNRGDIESKFGIDLNSESSYVHKPIQFEQNKGYHMLNLNFTENATVYFFGANYSLCQFIIMPIQSGNRNITLTLNFLGFGLFNDTNNNDKFEHNETYYELLADYTNYENYGIHSCTFLPLEKQIISADLINYSWGIRYDEVDLRCMTNGTWIFDDGLFTLFKNITTIQFNYSLLFNSTSKTFDIYRTNIFGTIETEKPLNFEEFGYGMYSLYTANYIDLQSESLFIQNEDSNFIESKEIEKIESSSTYLSIDSDNILKCEHVSKNYYSLYNEESDTTTFSNIEVDDYILNQKYGFNQDINLSIVQGSIYSEDVNITAILSYYIPGLENYVKLDNFHWLLFGISPLNLMNVYPVYDGNMVIHDPVFTVNTERTTMDFDTNPEGNPPNPPLLEDIEIPSSNGIVSLIWNSQNDIEEYIVYRSSASFTTPSIELKIGEVSGTTTTYQDTITVSGTYYYMIVASNSSGTATSQCKSVNVVIQTSSGGLTGLEWGLIIGGSVTIIAIVVIVLKKRKKPLNMEPK